MTQPEQYAHQPVLLEEVLELLPTRTDGFYVDGTFGRGGHSRALLQRLDERGLLVGIDRDPQAVAAGEELAGSDARFRIRAGRFDCLEQVVAEVGRPLDGVLLDLGVSSPQLDDPARGFSFMRDGPLDMRMDPTSGESAAQWLARADEKDIADVLYRYGEEKRSRAIARRIVEQRRQQPLATTAELAALIESVLGRGVPGKHPATRSFQAIRMHVNQEMAALEAVLDQALRCLAPGGRLLVISFHSLEDRLVKLFMRDAAGRTPQPRGLPVPPQPVLMRVLGKARQASDAEVAGNARARSAVLRAAEKVAA
ncbi:16S rRNA (cytosine(1402)-N(4))-methyltransferase RsmH [Alcanivorax quisquiliarum]|uniref:Ribosomal RNA small subunit methyltransferase H n=1 Tax=Alcanivorax quisquiliarum TaxID=2933565 RepID=A0ABT0E8I6_9GAMM|nr:16S rRNA (cytosine(1402)-N(4))-methyltransferase RsmH [Alcanivorax quisquiliarum]MCK0537944.1 16S rRNA (cytosine(1402)-N(4))-methyltransferase RsmH [Alcanivorax quisquiliarum]